jgi:hypothetical protein
MLFKDNLKLKIKMVFTADEIELIVGELCSLKKECTPEQLISNPKYSDFISQNKVFYEMIISEQGVDPIIFKEMLKMKRRLESGEDQYSVDVRFGQFMANKYIDPVINKPGAKP